MLKATCHSQRRGRTVLEIAAMKRLSLALCSAAAAVVMFPAVGASEPRGVVELFTSQGCNSCPPADKVIGDLARDYSLVAISLPVDYWDYLGWKDTLARPRHTARQRGYASVRGDRQIYTPQAVVNGVAHVIGSDREAIEGAIARTRGQAATLSVPISVSVGDDQITVDIKPAKEAEAVAEVWLTAVAKAIPVAIKRGENRGRTVTYHNVVRQWVKLGVWTGAKQSWTMPKSELQQIDGIDSVAVLVQAGGVENPGAVLGTATAQMR
jgi:hypothetical protein